jgi:hypothetical protein
MKNIINKSFKGLSSKYYLRQLLFGFLIFGLVLASMTDSQNYENILRLEGMVMIVFSLICVFLYPYSRFVYESVVNYILGDNLFFTNILIVGIFKFTTMTLCFFLAPFIAPVGLISLYIMHTIQERKSIQS